ncbi:hypothetical protein GCM10009798_43500 [Nocardioides panacihumi]|uniref:Uncharacterized protein n=1 Tax=Nocardioides panacihumi TaxID=400774 RepID=A0ABP5DED5_9ACTN
MTRVMGRWSITHREPVMLIRGRSAADILRRHGFKPLWSASGKGWVLDDRHLADVAAIAGMNTLGYKLLHADSSECQCTTAPKAQARIYDADPSECNCDLPDTADVTLLSDLLDAIEIGHFHREAS